jgi:hypothetical protein
VPEDVTANEPWNVVFRTWEHDDVNLKLTAEPE